MDWAEIEARWHDAIHHISAHWPETDPATLSALQGSRERFADYLARVHDLTVHEAADAIEDWLVLAAHRLRG